MILRRNAAGFSLYRPSFSVWNEKQNNKWMYFINLLCQRLVIPPDLPLHRDALPMNPSAKMQECFFFSPLSRSNTYSSPRGCVRRKSANSGGGVVSSRRATSSRARTEKRKKQRQTTQNTPQVRRIPWQERSPTVGGGGRR